MNDGQPLYSASHYEWYRKAFPWYARAWHRVKFFFVRPKFSLENLQEAHYDKVFISQDVGSADGDYTVVMGQRHGRTNFEILSFGYTDFPEHRGEIIIDKKGI